MKSREWVTRNADGSCPWNSGKEARPFKGIIVIDTDGDGKKPVTLNGTRSRGMDGIVPIIPGMHQGSKLPPDRLSSGDTIQDYLFTLFAVARISKDLP